MEPTINDENAPSNDFEQGDLLTKSLVRELSDHLFSLFQVVENGEARKMDSSNPKDQTKNDTRTAYFSKAKIDALFNANPGSDGLYVYFGAHKSTINPLPFEKNSYENKLTALLVTANGMKPNLLEDKQANTATGAGLALTRAKLCPPDIC